MPTQAEFEQAAIMLDHAGEQVSQLTSATQDINVRDVLRGGSLGALVPRRIQSAVATSQICQSRISEAAEICRARALIIAEYYVRLGAYDIASSEFDTASFSYWSQYDAWVRTEGAASHPGTPPPPPIPPDPPPEWADVRRP